MGLWELHGIGYVDPHVVGDAASIDVTAEGTSIIGAWEQDQLLAVMEALVVTGFDLLSARRLDAT